MLDLAAKYEDKLKLLFVKIAFDMKYKFHNAGEWRSGYEASKDTYNRHEFVSVDKNGEIVGYIAYSVCRSTHSAYALHIVNFSDDHVTFGGDLYRCLDDIFTKFEFNKLNYEVVVGNPVEKAYDRLTKKFGGRIVGTKYRECKLIDNKIYDYKMYEMSRENYLSQKKDIYVKVAE